MELQPNQAALVLESSEDGEITVNVAASDSSGFAASVCHIIALKLTQDEKFQAGIMDALDDFEEEDE